ncbi:MAG: hypothetical protein ACR2QK_17720 [Acidimicrobiales bacterium]
MSESVDSAAAPPSTPPTGKRLVLHIGFHETQTMVIQESMFGFRVGLRDHGVVYPQPLSGHQSHLDLATALGFNPRLGELSEFNGQAVVERYRRLVEDCPAGSTIVVSSEEFCQGNFRPFAMENLKVFLDKLTVDTTVVGYSRDPVQFLLAIYHHELRDTLSRSRFGEWLDHFDLAGADFDRRLEPWRELTADVGGYQAELRIRDYDIVRAEGVPLLVDFLATTGLGPIEMLSVEHPVSEIHPLLVEALIAVRQAELDPDQRRLHLEHLLEISALMAPVDAATVHLGQPAAADLARRLAELRVGRH